MNEANFVGMFVGIESPDPETLVQMRKKQNTRRSIPDSVHKINAAGMFVTAGFIVGFDNEKSGMADAMVELIEEVGDSGLHGRPALRAAQHTAHAPPHQGGPAASAARIRIEPRRSMHARPELRHAAAAQGHPDSTTGISCRRPTSRKPLPGGCASSSSCSTIPTRAHQSATGDTRRKFQSTVARIVERLPGARDEFKQILVQCATTNPSSLRTIVTLMAFYLHLGPFSRHVIEQIDHRIAELEVTSRRGAACCRRPPIAMASKRSRPNNFPRLDGERSSLFELRAAITFSRSSRRCHRQQLRGCNCRAR